MKILISHQKHGDMYWDASTPEKELAAYLALFQFMEAQGDYECCEPEGKELEFYVKALTNDAASAKRFIQMRKQYEYEGFSFGDVQDPMAVKA